MSTHDAEPNRRLLLVLVTLILGLDTLIYGLVVPFLPAHAASLGLGVSETGMLFAIFALAQVATLLAALRFAHLARPATLLIGGVIGIGISSVAFALSAESVAGLFFARALQGAAAAVGWIAGPALVASRFPESERGRATGLVLLGASVGSLVGPPLGGVLFEFGGFATPFLVITALSAVLLVVLYLNRGTFEAPVRPSGPRRSMGALIGLPSMIPTLLVVLVGASMLGLLEPMLPIQLTAVLGSTPLENGLVFGAAVVGYGISAPLSGWASDRLGRLRTSAIGLAWAVPALILFPLSTTWASLIAVAAALGAGIGFTLSPTMPAMADAADAADGPKDYTTVYSLHSLVYSSGLFVGPGLGGYLVEEVGLLTTNIGLATLCVGLVGLCLGAGAIRARDT